MLLYRHSNWLALWHLKERRGADVPSVTVTGEYAVTMRRVTPTDGPVHMVARVVESTDDCVTVEATLEARGKITRRPVAAPSSPPPRGTPPTSPFARGTPSAASVGVPGRAPARDGTFVRTSRGVEMRQLRGADQRRAGFKRR